MDAITYGSLFLMLGSTRLWVLTCSVSEIPGRHGFLSADAETQAELKDYILYEEDGHIGLYAKPGDSVLPLFFGTVTRMEVKAQGGRCVLHLEALTESYQMDLVVNNRSFQDTDMTSRQLVRKVLEPYPQSQILFSIEDTKLDQIVVQYQETDWAFLNRILSAYGVSAFIAGNEPGIYLRAGLMDTEEDADWDALPYVLRRDVAPRETGRTLKGQVCYQVEAYDILPLGEKVLFQGKELYIGKIDRFIRQGLLVSRYSLYFAEGLQVGKYHNPSLGGVSINGTVTAVSRNRLQVQMETDALAEYKKKYYFPFSTVAASPDGSGWYCMPRAGDQVRVFFPTADEKEGYAIANVQGESNPAPDSPMGNPDMKDITAPDGKAVRFIEGGIQLAVGEEKGLVTLTNDGAALITTDEDIEIGAAEAVCFTTDGIMSVTAGTQIRFINDAGGNITLTDEAVQIDAVRIINN
ncbi:hypothetical protein IMSAGC003_02184 [Lachnospiraceae bacterium]|nr:contractile injection system protein, VgrG/Pvc8 family [Acetatifactor sp.]GFH95633.1 hypothetical protein IMSAGC003_02184 [Lachnospiraceae bacterium]